MKEIIPLDLVRAEIGIKYNLMLNAMRYAGAALESGDHSIAWHTGTRLTSDFLPWLPRYNVRLGAGGTSSRLPTDRSLRKLKDAMQNLRTCLIDEPLRRLTAPAAGFIVRRQSCIVIHPDGEDRAGYIVVPDSFTAHDLLEESANLDADFPGRFSIVPD